jgi:hypothetical protein
MVASVLRKKERKIRAVEEDSAVSYINSRRGNDSMAIDLLGNIYR